MPGSHHTFESLATLNKAELEALLRMGTAPTLTALVGWDFRGWNLNPLTKVLGTRKFVKGFFGEDGAHCAWGYNLKVEPGRIDEPWIYRRDEEGEPERWYFFRVDEADQVENPTYPNAIIVDYAAWGSYPFFDPAKCTFDYLAMPDASNPDLLLGKAYHKAEKRERFLGYFILERHLKHDFSQPHYYLSNEGRETLRAMAEVMIADPVSEVSPDQIVETVDRYLDSLDEGSGASVRMGLWAIEHLLIPLRRFSRLGPVGCRKALEKLRNPRDRGFFGILRDLARLRTLVHAGYYQDPRVRESIGHRVPGPPTFPALPVRDQEIDLYEPVEELISCDVCVIGSGAGGAVVAYYLAKDRGLDVILIEAGDWVRTEEITHDEMAMLARLYRFGGLLTTRDRNVVTLQGTCLGGTTEINNCICFKVDECGYTYPMCPTLFERWAEMGVEVSGERFDCSYEEIRRVLDIEEIDDCQAGPNAAKLKEGWLALKGMGSPVWDPKAPPYRRCRENFGQRGRRCLACGYCNTGCPYHRKNSMLHTYIPKATQLGNRVRVLPRCRATRIEHKRGSVSAVHCTRRGRSDLTIQVTKGAVVSCGVIASSLLLRKSGIRRQVGQHVSFNIGSAMLARYKEPVDAWHGIQIGGYIDLGTYILESIFHPPVGLSAMMPGWFEKHGDRMKAARYLSGAGVLMPTKASGTVSSTGAIRYEMSRDELATMVQGLRSVAHIQFAARAQEVYPPTAWGDAISSVHDVDRELDFVKHPSDITLSTGHLQGGNVMSASEHRGVVDANLKVHEMQNLYVCDASVFPTSVRVNPQWTIMAMAHYFATNPAVKVD